MIMTVIDFMVIIPVMMVNLIILIVSTLTIVLPVVTYIHIYIYIHVHTHMRIYIYTCCLCVVAVGICFQAGSFMAMLTTFCIACCSSGKLTSKCLLNRQLLNR